MAIVRPSTVAPAKIAHKVIAHMVIVLRQTAAAMAIVQAITPAHKATAPKHPATMKAAAKALATAMANRFVTARPVMGKHPMANHPEVKRV